MNLNNFPENFPICAIITISHTTSESSTYLKNREMQKSEQTQNDSIYMQNLINNP